jgi:hypothetical protein
MGGTAGSPHGPPSLTVRTLGTTVSRARHVGRGGDWRHRLPFAVAVTYRDRVTSMADLITAVGEDRFRRACDWAWATAAGTGRPREPEDDHEAPEDVDYVPHDLEDLIWWQGEASSLARIDLAFELYRAMPGYGNLMYVRHHFFEWDDHAKKRFWDEYRTLLSDDDDRLADPVAYSLWCDYFEDSRTVEEAWEALATPGALSEPGMERLLRVSGPVPYGLKAPLYERLLPNARWHPFIFRSLFGSAFDVYGKVEADAALELLVELTLPETATEELEVLRRELEADPG